MGKMRIIDGDSIDRNKPQRGTYDFYSFIGSEFLRVFSEITKNLDLLKECYSPLRNESFDEELITEITLGIPRAIFGCDEIEPYEFLNDELRVIKYDQPILIFNISGGGKTTYIYHYFKINLKENKLDNKIEGIIIDLKNFGEGENIAYDKLKKFVHETIADHFAKQSKYDKINSPNIKIALELFNQELVPYKKLLKLLIKRSKEKYEDFLIPMVSSFIDNTEIFNRARIRYLLKSNKSVIIAIDNADHFGRKTQEKIFGLGSALMAQLRVNIMISARDYNFPFVFRHATLSPYEAILIHLSLPDAKDIIKKRIEYILKSKYIEKIFNIFRKDKIEIVSPSGIRSIFTKDSLEKQLNQIFDSLLSEINIKLLRNISNNNMRIMLEMIRVALSSGNLLPGEREDTKSVKRNDFLRAIICGSNQYYFPDDEKITILNIFDNNEPNFEGNNLIRLRILQSIDFFGKEALIQDVLEFLTSIGYPESKVKKTMQKMLSFNLIESANNEGDNIDKDNITTLRLTRTGIFYLNELIFDPVYLQEIKNSTILEETYIEVIESYMNEGKVAKEKVDRIKARLEATKVFIEALGSEEEIESHRIENITDPSAKINYKKIDKISEKISRTYNLISQSIIASLKKPKK